MALIECSPILLYIFFTLGTLILTHINPELLGHNIPKSNMMIQQIVFALFCTGLLYWLYKKIGIKEIIISIIYSLILLILLAIIIDIRSH